METITTCTTHCGAVHQSNVRKTLLLTTQNNNFTDEDDANIGFQQVEDKLGSDVCTEEHRTADNSLHVRTCISLEDLN